MALFIENKSKLHLIIDLLRLLDDWLKLNAYQIYLSNMLCTYLIRPKSNKASFIYIRINLSNII